MNSTTIGFQGELSPWCNFHHSPFEIDGKVFNTAETLDSVHQSSLFCFFDDKATAESIMECDTPLGAKRQGYNVQHFDSKLWNEQGYNLCLPGIRAKYVQNPMLMSMLKTKTPKLLVECSTDRALGNWSVIKRIWIH